MKLIQIGKLCSDAELKISFDTTIDKLEPLSGSNHGKASLTWINEKNIDQLNVLENTSVIVPRISGVDLVNNSLNYVITDNPRRLFQMIVKEYFIEEEVCMIAKSSCIHPSVKYGENVSVGENVVIEKDCILGNNVIIDHNTVIKRKTIIGNNVIIGCNSTIGGCGAGYEKNNLGDYEIIHHIGNVILEDNVEVGQNNTIDRAVLGSTILRKNVKTDNLVHIAHGVEVGRNTILTANAMVAGSSKIGENVWVGPSVSIMNKVIIGDNAFLGLGAVVLKSVESGDVMVGNPARKIR